MQCKKCGSDIQENSKFCPSCGAAVEKQVVENAPQASAPKSSMMKTIGKVVGGLIVLSIIGSCMSGNKDGNSSTTSKAPAKVVSQLNPDQVNFLKTVGIAEPTVISESGKIKEFKAQGNNYKLYTNDNNGVTKVSKIIGEREWYVWTDDHGKWDVPANDGKYIIIDIDDLNAQLKRNAARASKNFKNVDVKFTGLIANIDSDGDYISVKGQERFAIFSSFHCSLKDKKQKEVVMNKNKGSKVTIKGKITDVGEVLGYRVKVDEIQ